MNALNEMAIHAGEDTLFQHYTKMLREEVIDLFPSSGQVTVEWNKQEDDQGQPLYKLKVANLADIPGEAEMMLTPEDLAWPSQMRFLLLHLWGQVQASRGEKLLKQMHEARDREERNGSEPN